MNQRPAVAGEKSEKIARFRHWRWRFRIALVVLGVLLAGWAFVVEPASLVVERPTLVVPSLPPLRVVLLSDLHAGARFIDAAKIDNIVRQVNAEHADLVLLLGDFLNNGHTPGPHLKGGFMPPEEAAAALSPLRAKYGVFAVLGNHDWWLDGERVARALENAGIPVLENRSVSVTLGDGEALWLVGLGDHSEHKTDVARALANVPANGRAIALTHGPDAFPLVPERVALTVAGHTHGGQVVLPFYGPLVVPSDHGQRYARGHVEEAGHHLYVTSGIGTSIYPVRFLVRPEIVVLTLSPR